MKVIPSLFLVVACFVCSLALFRLYEWSAYPQWKVEATANGKWRSCLVEADWGFSTGCGSPMTYDEALWWSTTEGGTKVKP